MNASRIASINDVSTLSRGLSISALKPWILTGDVVVRPAVARGSRDVPRRTGGLGVVGILLAEPYSSESAAVH
jgi:hypothetical protein